MAVIALFASCEGLLSELDDPLVNGSCQAPPDQKGSFMGRVQRYPIEIVADAEFMETAVYASGKESHIRFDDGLRQAVARWNAIAQRIMKQDAFRLRFAKLAPAFRTLNPNENCDESYGDEDTFYIVRESSGSHWGTMGLAENVPGVTFRCTRRNRVAQQIIYLYPGQLAPEQFTSVAVHELGHSLGLDHSCLSGSKREDYRACETLTYTHEYRKAVMYPVIQTSKDPRDLEIKEDPLFNDRVRAACVIDPV